MAKEMRRRATYDDLLKVPDHLVAEIVDGELFTSPRPASPHARAVTKLGNVLGPAFDDGDGGPGGWWIVFEPELHLDDDVLVPDIAGWRRERMPVYPNVPAFTLAPDWVCEVVSPSTGRLDRIRKMPAYARHGISYIWVIDPLQQTLEVFQLKDGQWFVVATHEGADVVRAVPFDAIEIDLARLWIPT